MMTKVRKLKFGDLMVDEKAEDLPGLQEKDWAGIIGFSAIIGTMLLLGLSGLFGFTIDGMDTLVTAVVMIITFYFGRKL